MNRLKKKTQREFASVTASCIILTPLFLFLTKRNTQGLDTLIICLAAGLTTAFFAGLFEFRFYKKLDEREKDIYVKAMIFSMFVFVGFWIAFTLIAFLIIGGMGAIPVGILPLILLGSFLVAQGSETAFLTIYFLRENNE